MWSYLLNVYHGPDTKAGLLHKSSLILTIFLYSGYYICSSSGWEGGTLLDKWETISLGSRDYYCRVRRSGITMLFPKWWLEQDRTRLYGTWSFGFRGRCLVAGAGIQADFVSLANGTFVHSVSPLIGPDNKEVCMVYMMETMQNKAQSSAVLLIQINDPHLQMKLVPDRLLALGG